MPRSQGLFLEILAFSASLRYIAFGMANPDIADQASAGGKARAASLPKVRRVEIARKAARTRWGKKQKRKAAA